MIILIAILPVKFALNHHKEVDHLSIQVSNIETVIDKVNQKVINSEDKASLIVLNEEIDTIQSMLAEATSFNTLKKEYHFEIRKNILLMNKEWAKLLSPKVDGGALLLLSDKDKNVLKDSFNEVKGYIEYVPVWTILLISISLGLGTMIGWKRIVVTIGEKIGKEHLTYAQGASRK